MTTFKDPFPILYNLFVPHRAVAWYLINKLRGNLTRKDTSILSGCVVSEKGIVEEYPLDHLTSRLLHEGFSSHSGGV
jgi:hypothetical protein